MYAQVIWDEDDEPDGNVQHIAGHGITPEEYEDVLHNDTLSTFYSNSSGNPGKIGWTSAGRRIVIIWKELCNDPRIVYPVTAFDDEPEND